MSVGFSVYSLRVGRFPRPQLCQTQSQVLRTDFTLQSIRETSAPRTPPRFEFFIAGIVDGTWRHDELALNENWLSSGCGEIA